MHFNPKRYEDFVTPPFCKHNLIFEQCGFCNPRRLTIPKIEVPPIQLSPPVVEGPPRCRICGRPTQRIKDRSRRPVIYRWKSKGDKIVKLDHPTNSDEEHITIFHHGMYDPQGLCYIHAKQDKGLLTCEKSKIRGRNCSKCRKLKVCIAEWTARAQKKRFNKETRRYYDVEPSAPHYLMCKISRQYADQDMLPDETIRKWFRYLDAKAPSPYGGASDKPDTWGTKEWDAFDVDFEADGSDKKRPNTELDHFDNKYRHLPGLEIPSQQTLKEFSSYLLDDRQNRFLWKQDKLYGQGLTIAQIATQERISYSAAKQVISRANQIKAKGLFGIWSEQTWGAKNPVVFSAPKIWNFETSPEHPNVVSSRTYKSSDRAIILGFFQPNGGDPKKGTFVIPEQWGSLLYPFCCGGFRNLILHIGWRDYIEAMYAKSHMMHYYFSYISELNGLTKIPCHLSEIYEC